jgi:RecB family exonuclease
VARGRAGRFGHGVVYGPLSSAVGHDLDAVFIVGCREGMLPSPRRDDAVLPDAARVLANGELELRAGQLGEQHRQFLAAVASAPPGRRTLLIARGDLRTSRESLPSRWLLDSASALAGRPVRATDFAQLGEPVVEVVPSHRAGIAISASHGSVTERDLAAVEQHVAIGGDAIDHPAAADARRGIAASRARRSPLFTEWDGNLAGHELGSTADRPLSPTRLQTWAACGYRYFLAHVLGLSDRDDPDRLVDISPLDRGSGVHLVLETFLRELLDADEMPSWDQPWTPAHRARVAELAVEVFDAYEAQGRTGRPVRWRITREDLLMLLDDFLHADDAHRASHRATPVSVEMSFGMGDADPLVIALPDGRELRFRGMADRLDRSDDGRTFVSDYKTGKGKEYVKIDEGDPVNAGTTLQLGLYAEAARQFGGADDVDAHYWQVNQAVGHRRSGYHWSDDRRQRLIDVLTVIADGIEGGEFATDPGEWNSWQGTNDSCMFCPFDSVCDRDRGEHAAAKADRLVHRPQLAWVEPADREPADRDGAEGGA